MPLALQQVSKVAQRKRVILWMINLVEAQGSQYRIAAQPFDNFPSVFREQKHSAGCQKAQDWWKNRIQYLNHTENAPRDLFL